MKKWFYVLFPAILLGVFLFYYTASKAETELRDKAQKAEMARLKAEADQKKALAEAKAREDAERRSAERAAEEAKTAKEKEDRYNSDMARIKEDTDRSNATAETYSKQVSELTIELDNLHKQKDTMTRESFELEKKVELAEVARRNAELEIQRFTAMLADRADQSLMVKPPPPPVSKE
jgi:chromosome segregation ATPase